MKVSTRTIRVDHLSVDHQVQRALDSNWVAKKVNEGFDVSGLGVPVVSLREDGSYHLVDGQHRIALAVAAGRPELVVTCQCYEGLTKPEEASLFLVLNDRRKVQPVDRFRVAVIEGDEQTVRLNNIVTHAGWHVVMGKYSGCFAAVSALYWVANGAAERTDGNQYPIVSQLIDVITTAWGHDSDGVRAEIVKGLGAVLTRHEGRVDLPVLIKRLAAVAGGPLGLVGMARGLKALRGYTVHDGVADAVIGLYNKKRRASSALPVWVPAHVAARQQREDAAA